MQTDTIGWIACGCSLLGAALASSYTRRIVFWGWITFLVANVFWVVYGATQQTVLIPLIAYNAMRGLLNLRGARNNTWKRKQAIRKQRKQQQCSPQKQQ